ncbi:unnamed protein product [Scytosiphon promiscuus]
MSVITSRPDAMSPQEMMPTSHLPRSIAPLSFMDFFCHRLRFSLAKKMRIKDQDRDGWVGTAHDHGHGPFKRLPPHHLRDQQAGGSRRSYRHGVRAQSNRPREVAQHHVPTHARRPGRHDRTRQGWPKSSTIVGASLNIPVSNGCLALGTWQGVYLCEHRDTGDWGGGFARDIVITIQGITSSE